MLFGLNDGQAAIGNFITLFSFPLSVTLWPLSVTLWMVGRTPKEEGEPPSVAGK